jgi:hypothetical protein
MKNHNLILSLRRKVPKAKTLEEMFDICSKLDELGDWKCSARLSVAWLNRHLNVKSTLSFNAPKVGMPRPFDELVLRNRLTMGRHAAVECSGRDTSDPKKEAKRIEERLANAMDDPALLAAYEEKLNGTKQIDDPTRLFAAYVDGEPRLLTHEEMTGEPLPEGTQGYYRTTIIKPDH